MPVVSVDGVVVEAVVEVVPVVPARRGVRAGGAVEVGRRLGLRVGDVVVEPQPPQAEGSRPASSDARPRRRVMRAAHGGALDAGQDASGAMRRPHVGQSLRSFCASWSHQLQKRRFSTAHGSRDGDGASGMTLPTTSSSSPVSRSR